jgi:hypothetical protein
MARPFRKWFRKLKRLNNVRKRRNQGKIRAAKKAATAQTRITRESRKTAGELRASGAFEWQGSGMPDNTLMEPVRAQGGGWEWVPVTNKQGKPMTRRPAAMSNDRKKAPGTTPETSSPELMAWLGNASAIASGHTRKCGAPTKDKTPCERLGDCPIPAHKRWRNGR